MVESDLRFKQIASTIEDMFWIMELKNEELVYISPAAKKISGYTADEFLRKKLHGNL